MKKNILNNIDILQEERKLSKEAEKKIFGRAIANGAIGISIIILVMIFIIAANHLSKMIATTIFNICAIVFLVFTITIIEIAYKKDSDTWALTAIEMIILSIFILFAPYIFIHFNYKIIYGFIAVTTIYYVFRIIRIYCVEKRKYLTEISDITDIIKKESDDKLAEEEKARRIEEKKRILEQRNKKTTKNKSVVKKTTNTTKKKATTQKKKTTTKKPNTSTKKKETTKKTDNEKKTTDKKEKTKKESK